MKKSSILRRGSQIIRASILLISFVPLSTLGDQTNSLLILVTSTANALREYAKEHSGQLPNKLDELRPTYADTTAWYIDDIPLPVYASSNILHVPRKAPISIIYVPHNQLSIDLPDRTVIAFISRPTEKENRYIILDNYQVLVIDEAYFQEQIAGKNTEDSTIAIEIE